MKRDACSVTIITFNEEKNLPECLASVSWADEVVVIDSGSTDQTEAIARAHGCKVYHHSWEGMREQKNHATEKAAGPWILNLDADERVSPELALMIQEELSAPRHSAYEFPRKNFFLGKWMRHGGWYPDAVLRLFRKGEGAFGGVNPHANVVLHQSGRIGRLSAPLVHFTYFTLEQYVKKQYVYADAAAREIFLRKRPARISAARIAVKTGWKFIENYVLKRGFLDGAHGLVAAAGSAFGAYLKQARLWELCRTEQVKQTGPRDASPASRP